ncbi:hypothetical protein TWF281_003287 [Arthrobotrys megalospora]
MDPPLKEISSATSISQNKTSRLSIKHPHSISTSGPPAKAPSGVQKSATNASPTLPTDLELAGAGGKIESIFHHEQPEGTVSEADPVAENPTIGHSVPTLLALAPNTTSPPAKDTNVQGDPMSNQYSATHSLSRPLSGEILQDKSLPTLKHTVGPSMAPAQLNPADKRYGNIVRPEFFYEGNPVVMCWDPDEVIDANPPGPNGWPTVGAVGNPSSHRIDYQGMLQNRPRGAIINGIRGVLRGCRECQCQEGDGVAALHPGPRDAALVRNYCLTELFARKCMAWYGCRCYVQLGQPDPTPTYPATLEEWQSAIDSIPEIIKAYNAGWKWTKLGELTNDPNFYLTFSDPRYRGASKFELVPGTKEPFFLQGPTTPEERRWYWSSSRFNYMGASGHSGLLGSPSVNEVYKRESSNNPLPRKGFPDSVQNSENFHSSPLPENQSPNLQRSLLKNPETAPAAITPTKTINMTLGTCLDWADVPSLPDASAKLSEGKIRIEKHYEMLIQLCHRDCRCVPNPTNTKEQRYGCQRPPEPFPPSIEPLIRYCEQLCFCEVPEEVYAEGEEPELEGSKTNI